MKVIFIFEVILIYIVYVFFVESFDKILVMLNIFLVFWVGGESFFRLCGDDGVIYVKFCNLYNIILLFLNVIL